MKKTMVTLLALVFVLSIAATAFAAPANPFVDVPAKHWAYGAVTKLAQAGIVDGYGDGTFRGDKTMTRYEMAQIVAKAMAKSEKADAEQKALIDKLAVEFAAELNNLGVRVAKLEKNASSIKFSGDARIRYLENFSINGAGAVTTPASGRADSQRFNERVRLYMDANLNDKAVFAGRLTVENTNRDGLAGTDTPLTVDFANFTFKDAIGGVDIGIGRYALGQGFGLISGTTGGYDSFRLTGGGKEVKGWISHGDTSPKWTTSNAAAQTENHNPNIPVAGFDGKVSTWNIAWVPNKDFTLTSAGFWSATTGYNYKVYAFGAKAKVLDNLWITGEWAKNTADTVNSTDADVPAVGTDQKTAWFAQLGYKGADRSKPGTFGLFLNYKKYGAHALDYNLPSIPVFENINDAYAANQGVKGLGYGFNYAIAKNTIVTVVYEDLESYNGANNRPNFTYARAEFWF